jgi:hypothetical protein
MSNPTSTTSAAKPSGSPTYEGIKDFSRQFASEGLEGVKDGAALEVAHSLTDALVAGISKQFKGIELFYATAFGHAVLLFMVPYLLGILSLMFPDLMMGLSGEFVRKTTTRAARAAAITTLTPILRNITAPVRDVLYKLQEQEKAAANAPVAAVRDGA